jgi:hypothetical protein
MWISSNIICFPSFSQTSYKWAELNTTRRAGIHSGSCRKRSGWWQHIPQSEPVQLFCQHGRSKWYNLRHDMGSSLSVHGISVPDEYCNSFIISSIEPISWAAWGDKKPKIMGYWRSLQISTKGGFYKNDTVEWIYESEHAKATVEF